MACPVVSTPESKSNNPGTNNVALERREVLVLSQIRTPRENQSPVFSKIISLMVSKLATAQDKRCFIPSATGHSVPTISKFKRVHGDGLHEQEGSAGARHARASVRASHTGDVQVLPGVRQATRGSKAPNERTTRDMDSRVNRNDYLKRKQLRKRHPRGYVGLHHRRLTY